MFIVALVFPTVINGGIATATTPEPKLYIDPASIIDPGLLPGSNITISVKVANVTDLYSWQVKIYYNPDMLIWTGAWYPVGHVFYGRMFTPVTPVNGSDPGGTYILYFATLMGEEPGFTGSGVLCKVNFTTKTIGSSNLTFSRPLGATTWLLDSNLDKIEFVAQDGYVDNKPPPSPAALHVDPPRIINPLLVNCTNFTVDVRIKNATNLRSFAIKVGFDPVLLEVKNAQLGAFFPPGVIPTVLINNVEGYATISASLPPQDPSLNGDGVMVTINFHVKDLGFCDITLYDTSLINAWGDSIPHDVAYGYFNNLMMAKLAVEPPEVRDPTLVPYESFTINITVAEVENLYGYEFKLRYNSSIIACIKVTVNDVFGEVHYIPNFAVDNAAGVLWVKVEYFEPAVPVSTLAPIALVELKFRVIRRGISVLDLYDTYLEDPLGGPIVHEVYDGIFAPLIQDGALVTIVPRYVEAYSGWLVPINVTIRNEGNLTETFTARVYYGNNTLIGSLVFVDVNPNEEATLTINWSTKGVAPCRNYTIWAELLPLPYETDLSDNVLIDGEVWIILMGDVNRDGVVDGLDLSAVARAFGSFPGHPRWKQACDLNNDGFIEGLDITRVAVNYGKSC